MDDSGEDQSGVSELITPALLAILRAEYRLSWHGIHGYSHWVRVRENGLRLAEMNGANPKVVEYFAFIHDNQRQNDWLDPGHGKRASDLVRTKLVGVLNLTREELEMLCEACAGHNKGRVKANLTVQTCWDADRLDLMRAGIRPGKRHLCTAEAKQDAIIQWAVERSIRSRGGR